MLRALRKSQYVAIREAATRPALPLIFTSNNLKHFSIASLTKRQEVTQSHKNLLTPIQDRKNAPLRSKTKKSDIPEHNDLTSFIRSHQIRIKSTPDPVKRVKMSQSSVFLGTRYEYLIKQHLESHLNFQLTRIGKTGDQGVDLIGTWTLPLPEENDDPTTTFRVIIQAKRMASNRTLQPRMMRELEGTLVLASGMTTLKEAFVAHGLRLSGGGDTGENVEARADLSHLMTLGILVATRPLTDGAMEVMARSRRPMMYILLEDSSLNTLQMESDGVDDEVNSGLERQNHAVSDAETIALREINSSIPTTTVKQIVWNSAAARAGLEGYDVVRNYGGDKSVDINNDGLGGQAMLAYQGRPIHVRNQPP